MKKPTLRKFANAAGVEVVPNGPGWGGRWGYRTKDCPNCMSCGFKTIGDARRGWAVETFGEHAAKALFDLLGEAA